VRARSVIGWSTKAATASKAAVPSAWFCAGVRACWGQRKIFTQ
jgi:hypothetical protein